MVGPRDGRAAPGLQDEAVRATILAIRQPLNRDIPTASIAT
jgi:hypothetical protein